MSAGPVAAPGVVGGGARFVVLTRVGDRGAAEVAEQALVDAGIAVELRQRGANPYFGSVTATEFEVRVPPARVADGERVLARLAVEVEQAVLAEAGVPPDADDDERDDERDPGAAALPAERPRKVTWALSISALMPFPMGCFYARAHGLAALLLGLYFGGIVISGVTEEGRHILQVIGVAKLADLLLAPLCVLRYNARRRRRPDADTSPSPDREAPHGAHP